jgi:hypothetical protein
MNDPKALTARQSRVIPYLLAAPSLEAGCKRAQVSKVTVYEWLKQEGFRNELKCQRDELIQRALDTLKTAIAKATETLVKHLDSQQPNVSLRAAQSIIEFAQNALASESLEKRITALEERLIQQRGTR